MTENLLTIPRNAAQFIWRNGGVVVYPLLWTDKFVKFCTDRGLSVDRKRLLRLERLGLFAPLFRVLTPPDDVPLFSLPPRDGNDWFEKGWAWDTTGLGLSYPIPDPNDREQEGYYSAFQIDYLDIVLSGMTASTILDSYLDHPPDGSIKWEEKGERLMIYARQRADGLRTHEYRRAVALLCQFISDRYGPHTKTDQRTMQVPLGTRFYSDRWISVTTRDWDWYDFARNWDPHEAERLFALTPAKLKHAYEGLASTQSFIDPVERWYQLIQFVSVRERERLKGDALCAETLRAGAHMLRRLFKDLYGDDLRHPNEVTSIITTHIPELAVREDTRRHLELVVNRYGLNPQPTAAIIVEGPSEEAAIRKIFERHFGAHYGRWGVEIIILGGVDAATGAREDRFRAILRLIDYLHHHQTFAFLILDNENYAAKLKAAAKKARSIHHKQRYVTRPEYIRIWKKSFEFDNFSPTEIAAAATQLARGHTKFSPSEVAACSKHANPGHALTALFKQKANYGLNKIRLSEALVDRMFLAKKGKRIANRPIVKTLERITRLAALNPFPTMQETWEVNQASRFLGKRVR